MGTAYFITAAGLCIWAYLQTRSTARSIRDNRRHMDDRLG